MEFYAVGGDTFYFGVCLDWRIFSSAGTIRFTIDINCWHSNLYHLLPLPRHPAQRRLDANSPVAVSVVCQWRYCDRLYCEGAKIGINSSLSRKLGLKPCPSRT